MPRVVEVDGRPWWIVDDDVKLGPARGGGVVDRAGEKYPFEECKHNGIDWVHPAAYDPEARLALMDECGVHALAALRPETRRKVLGDTAAALYRI